MSPGYLWTPSPTAHPRWTQPRPQLQGSLDLSQALQHMTTRGQQTTGNQTTEPSEGETSPSPLITTGTQQARCRHRHAPKQPTHHTVTPTQYMPGTHSTQTLETQTTQDTHMHKPIDNTRTHKAPPSHKASCSIPSTNSIHTPPHSTPQNVLSIRPLVKTSGTSQPPDTDPPHTHTYTLHNHSQLL